MMIKPGLKFNSEESMEDLLVKLNSMPTPKVCKLVIPDEVVDCLSSELNVDRGSIPVIIQTHLDSISKD